jgi:pimeloyl-ACP methyl ester carboxylesterase
MPTIESTRLGKGFPVIFLHGFCETKEMWFPFVAPLAQHYCVITINLPGFGDSPLDKTEITLEEIADELADWFQSNELEKAVIIGHSLGGYVALALAERHPQLIQGLGLFHSMAYADDSESRHRRDKALLFLKKHPVEKFIVPFIPSLFYESRKEELQEEIRKSTKTGLKTPLATIIAYTLAMRERKDRFEVWKNLPCHCLFIGGMNDSRIPVSVCEQHIDQRQLVDSYILPETAHMGMFERPSATLQMIQDYLLKVI